MSTPSPDRYSGADPRLVRDLLAVLFLVLGAVALIYAGFLFGRPVGWATVGVLALTAGVALGYDRAPR